MNSAATECAHDLLVRGEEVLLCAHGGSMRPFVRAGDRLTFRSEISALKVGDIAWFRIGEHEVIHRVIALTKHGAVQLRGDALPDSDGWFEAQDYLGTLVALVRNGQSHRLPTSSIHRCFVAFIRGLRHIVWKLRAIA
jgi:hypothetical protein